MARPPLEDPYAAAWRRVAEGILDTPGRLTPAQRRAIFAGDDPPELAALLAKVRTGAYRIVDRDVEHLDDDTVVEAVLAAALAQGELRRRAARDALA